MIPFKIKLLTETAKAPTKENEGDLWDIYADDFCGEYLKDQPLNDDSYETENEGIISYFKNNYTSLWGNAKDGFIRCTLQPQGRILVKTGISIELPINYIDNKDDSNMGYHFSQLDKWQCLIDEREIRISNYAVADIRPRSGLALKHGITVLNTPGTIDNSYRKEIGVILYNAGHEPYTINKGDKIAQMLIRPLYPSKMEIVENIEDTQRGGFGSTGK
jgi:deoxyuridine 5'-triphosphate nucleotidohydrolase